METKGCEPSTWEIVKSWKVRDKSHTFYCAILFFVAVDVSVVQQIYVQRGN